MTILELLGRLYRVFRWVLLAASMIVFFLILRPDTPPEVQVDAKALASLQSKVASMHQAAAGQARELHLNEAELNGWLRSNLAVASASPSPKGAEDPTAEEAQSNVRDVRVTLDGDRIHGYVLFELYGKNLSLTLNGRLELRDGYLRLTPTAMKLGSFLFRARRSSARCNNSSTRRRTASSFVFLPEFVTSASRTARSSSLIDRPPARSERPPSEDEFSAIGSIMLGFSDGATLPLERRCRTRRLSR